MANGASCLQKVLASSVTVAATGAFGEIVSLNAEADDIGIIVTIESGTADSLICKLEQKVGSTWVAIGGATSASQTVASDVIAFASAPSSGLYRVNATTVTNDSSLVVSAKLVYGKKADA